MNDPYFEKQLTNENEILYPFCCFISDSCQKNFMINPHWHYYIEVLYYLSGDAKIFLGGDYYNVKTGDLILINAREVHSISSTEGISTKYIVIKFDPEILYTTTRTAFEAKYVIPFTMAKSTHQKVFLSENIGDTIIPSLVNEILEEYSDKKYGFELAVHAGICRLFLWVLRYWQDRGLNLKCNPILKEIDTQKFQALFEYLDNHYNDDISAESMAKMCNMSYSYFCRYFKKVMGKTFTEYLNYIRVTEAEKLLLTADMNITQIATSTGFSNCSYFIKQFRHFKNFPPKKFLKKFTSE